MSPVCEKTLWPVRLCTVSRITENVHTMTAMPQALSRVHYAFAKLAMLKSLHPVISAFENKKATIEWHFPSMSIISIVLHFKQFLRRKRDPDKSFSSEI